MCCEEGGVTYTIARMEHDLKATPYPVGSATKNSKPGAAERVELLFGVPFRSDGAIWTWMVLR